MKDRNRNLVATISYFAFFITGIVVFLAEKDDKFIRFHALQSIMVFGGLFGISVVLGLLFGPFSFLGIISSLINNVIWIAWLIIWLVSMVKAYRGQIFKWPIAGELAEKYA
ncbi:DUF4870 domain-containing protein [Candidatus Curtissbacteria bacterium]|nr:DUF4870 domain-containing protein [Candidatus Curtissbacteria bacterium]